MEILPNEMIYEIIEKLRGKDIVNFCAANKRFHRITKDELYWERRYKREFPYLHVLINTGYFITNSYFFEFINECLYLKRILYKKL
jgi:hypothetical protein